MSFLIFGEIFSLACVNITKLSLVLAIRITFQDLAGWAMKPKDDWHRADVIAELHKRGTSLAALSRSAGLSSSTLSNTLDRPWPKGEWLIASRLGKHPAEIWPSRYFDERGRWIERFVRGQKLPVPGR